VRRKGATKPHQRLGYWHLNRRVPQNVQHLDRRGNVRITTGISVREDPYGVRAREVVAKLDAELTIYWEGLLAGQSDDARVRFEAAQQRARQLGFHYKTVKELAQAPVHEIIERMQFLAATGKIEDAHEVAAVLGGEARPEFTVSGMVDEFARLKQTTLDAMSPDQRRKWRNQKERAQDNFKEVVTDKPLSALTRADVMQFRNWWQDKLRRDGLDIGTANKDIGNVSKMFATINRAHELGLKPLFAEVRFERVADKQRAAFTREHVEKKILPAGVLDALNEEARDIVYLIAETGLRLSEACNLTAATIHLGGTVPHVTVAPDGRVMKTADSARDVPLVGVALEAMKRHPDGFPRYRDRSASLSALIAKALKARELLPTKQHSLYSLRHTFEDRLTAAEAPEKVVASLMGHKWHRPRYGTGPSLEQKLEWLQRIAYRPAAAPPSDGA
jgi:integrase